MDNLKSVMIYSVCISEKRTAMYSPIISRIVTNFDKIRHIALVDFELLSTCNYFTQEIIADGRKGKCATAVRIWRSLAKKSKLGRTSPPPEPNMTSIAKPVANLWPLYLYIQDDRQPPSWILKIESCTIRSADHENPTPEPNIMSLCCI